MQLEVYREISNKTILAYQKGDGKDNAETGVTSNSDLSKESEVKELTKNLRSEKEKKQEGEII